MNAFAHPRIGIRRSDLRTSGTSSAPSQELPVTTGVLHVLSAWLDRSFRAKFAQSRGFVPGFCRCLREMHYDRDANSSPCSAPRQLQLAAIQYLDLRRAPRMGNPGESWGTISGATGAAIH